MRAFAADTRAALVQAGRLPDGARIMMSVMPFIGATRAEAEALRDEHNALANPLVGLSTLGAHTNADFSELPMEADMAALVSSGSQGNLAALKSIAGDMPMTLAEAGRIYARGVMCPQVVGTARDVADELIAIVDEGAADGFAVSPAYLPDTFDAFVDGVVPLLRRAGRVRRAYHGPTLRGMLGL